MTDLIDSLTSALIASFQNIDLLLDADDGSDEADARVEAALKENAEIARELRNAEIRKVEADEAGCAQTVLPE